jgi:hypothetical protein
MRKPTWAATAAFWASLALTVGALLILILSSPVFAQASPDGTRMPPAPEIIDEQGNHWRIGTGKGGEPNSLDNVTVMVICWNLVYANIPNGNWYRGVVGNGWILVGTTDPCPAK